MNRHLLKFCTINLLCVLLSSTGFSQKVIGIPEAFTEPFFTDRYSVHFSRLEIDNYNKTKAPWGVYADRSDAIARDAPDVNANEIGKLEFGDVQYLVIDENKNWLKLIKPIKGKKPLNGRKIITNNVEEIGWVDKEELLLWNRGMINRSTKINSKAFILNKLRNVDVGDLKSAKLYSTPAKTKSIGELPLYEFYYIYDVSFNQSGEPEMFLLGTQSNFLRGEFEKTILGWVEYRKLNQWNTRLALEPNHNKKAYAEREEDESLRLRGYINNSVANKIAGGNYSPISSEILWNDDPANGKNKNRLGQHNPRRFKGEAQRFPLLKYNAPRRKGYGTFISGVIANINSKDAQGNTEVIKGLRSKYESLKNVNLVFLFEACDDSAPSLRDETIAVIEALYKELGNENLSVGVCTYRDLLESDPERRYKVVAATKDQNKVMAALNSIVFKSFDESDDYTTLEHAMHTTVKRGGFVEGQTNILVHVGSNPDISSSARRKRFRNVSQDLIDEYTITDEDENTLRKLVADYRLNILHAQSDFTNGRPNLDFQDKVYSYMSDLPKKIYVEERLGNLTDCEPPVLPDFETGKIMEIPVFLTTYAILTPQEGEKLSRDQYFDFSFGYISRIMQEVSARIDQTTEVAEGNSTLNVSAGNYTREGLNILKDVAKEQGYTTKEQLDEFFKKISENSELYAEVYFPSDILPGAQHQAYSYVLLFPEDDLENYSEEMYKLRYTAENGDDAARRENLKEYLYQLAVGFTNDDNRIRAGEISIEDIARHMQGVAGEGFNIFGNGGLNFKIKDITNRKRFSSEEYDAFIARLAVKNSKLEDILSSAGQPDGYEFSYTDKSGNRYFWVPVEYVF